MNSRAEVKEPYRLEKSQSQVRSRKARNANSGSMMQFRGQAATAVSTRAPVIWGKSFQLPSPGKSLCNFGQ